MLLVFCCARSAIQSIIYTDEVKDDEERIQTGAVTVNITKEALIKEAKAELELLWLDDKLPHGDSRCRDGPSSEQLIKQAINSLRNTFGADIHFANSSDQWFVCQKCWEQNVRRRQGFHSVEARNKFVAECKAHTALHKVGAVEIHWCE